MSSRAAQRDAAPAVERDHCPARCWRQSSAGRPRVSSRASSARNAPAPRARPHPTRSHPCTGSSRASRTGSCSTPWRRSP